MAAGNDLTGPGLKNEAGGYASQFYALMQSLLGWDERLTDHGGPLGSDITSAYTSVYGATDPNAAAKGAQDADDLNAMVNAIKLIVGYATGSGSNGIPLPASGGQSVIDNTTGSAPATTTIPVGAKCYVVTNADMIAQHDGVGVDKGPVIRKLAGTKNY